MLQGDLGQLGGDQPPGAAGAGRADPSPLGKLLGRGRAIAAQVAADQLGPASSGSASGGQAAPSHWSARTRTALLPARGARQATPCGPSARNTVSGYVVGLARHAPWRQRIRQPAAHLAAQVPLGQGPPVQHLAGCRCGRLDRLGQGDPHPAQGRGRAGHGHTQRRLVPGEDAGGEHGGIGGRDQARRQPQAPDLKQGLVLGQGTVDVGRCQLGDTGVQGQRRRAGRKARTWLRSTRGVVPMPVTLPAASDTAGGGAQRFRRNAMPLCRWSSWGRRGRGATRPLAVIVAVEGRIATGTRTARRPRTGPPGPPSRRRGSRGRARWP
jgi:hypothetical protein